MNAPARIPADGNRRDLGFVNWVFCKLAARRQRVPRVHLFTTLGQHTPLLWSWLPFGGYLLYRGKFSRRDAEVVILRVAHLRGSEYELQQHRRLARGRGVDAALQEMIFAGPKADGLTERHRVLLAATDEFVLERTVSDSTWQELSEHLDKEQLIEFCLLAGHYDMLAAMMSTLRIPLDYTD